MIRKSSIASLAGRSVVGLALLLALTSAGAGQERIIAVGDVHGAFPQLGMRLEFRHPVYRTIITSRIVDIRASEQLASDA